MPSLSYLDLIDIHNDLYHVYIHTAKWRLIERYKLRVACVTVSGLVSALEQLMDKDIPKTKRVKPSIEGTDYLN